MRLDAEDILDGLIRGALGSRGKRSRGALRALRGHGSLVNARTLLAAAGVAWGLYEAASRKTGSTAPGAPSPAPGPAASPPAPPPPPLPGGAASGALPEHVLRLVRLTISAARADGDLALEERGVILEHARKVGAEAVVAQELQSPRPLREITAGVEDPRLAADLYTLAFTLVRADESVTGAERIYLAQLAHQLGLDAPAAARLEAEAAARIDAQAGP
ncbi:MAG TPA: DUF533 domain-containing protein [Vicinamibacteria bacterium]|nr:DUF533 domain-containing protein [Vicinamibacteria bacterium]